MRILKRIVLCMVIVSFLLPFTGNRDVRAEGETVNYVFTGLAVPAGQSEVFTVDAGHQKKKPLTVFSK